MKLSTEYPCQQINAPELMAHPEFTEWLNKSASLNNAESRTATWHNAPNEIGEYSDVFLWKDKGREGSDSDMPEDVWNQICDTVGLNFAGIVWITFYGDADQVTPPDETAKQKLLADIGNKIRNHPDFYIQFGNTIVAVTDPNIDTEFGSNVVHIHALRYDEADNIVGEGSFYDDGQQIGEAEPVELNDLTCEELTTLLETINQILSITHPNG